MEPAVRAALVGAHHADRAEADSGVAADGPVVVRRRVDRQPVVAALRSDGPTVLLVVEIGGEVAGGIQYNEEDDPRYRHAGIDIYLSGPFQGQGAGAEAVALLAGFLFRHRGHHRLTIDPAAANERAIRCYTKVGFRPVGVMRAYERGADGQFYDGLLMDMLAAELRCGL